MRRTILISILVLAALFLALQQIPKRPRPASSSLATLRQSNVYTQYQRLEGPALRGFWFQETVTTLDHLKLNGEKISRKDVLQIMGVPDRVEPTTGTFAYFYDRFAKKDWVVYVDFDASGKWVSSLGYNDSSVNNHSAWIAPVSEESLWEPVSGK